MMDTLQPDQGQLRLLLSVKQVAQIVASSERTLWRLSDSGQMPSPVRIGRSVRWRRSDILRWVELGCPSRQVFEETANV